MSYSQLYQDISPAHLEEVAENIRTQSFENLFLSDRDILCLAKKWYRDEESLKTESCNFTNSLFANNSTDEETLLEGKKTLEGIFNTLTSWMLPGYQSFTLDYRDLRRDRPALESFKILINLAINDCNMWLEVKQNNFGDAIRHLSELKKRSKGILPWRVEVYSSVEPGLMRQNPIQVFEGEDYKTEFNSWVKSFKDHTSQTKIPEEVASYLTSDKYLNLKKLDSDEEYFHKKMRELAKGNTDLSRIVSRYNGLWAVSVFSPDQLSENISILERILKKIKGPYRTKFGRFDIVNLNYIFTKFLRYHQYYSSGDPKEKELFLQGIYNSFFEYDISEFALKCDCGHKINFEMSNVNDSYLLLVLKHFAKERTKIELLYYPSDVSPFNAPPWPSRFGGTFDNFSHRIDVLNNLIKKIDTFEEITPESKDYLKKLFNLFLLDHQAGIHSNKNRPEEAMKCLCELKEKSKGIVLYYFQEGGKVDELIETCQSQISKNKTEDEQDHSVSKMVRPSESEVD